MSKILFLAIRSSQIMLLNILAYYVLVRADKMSFCGGISGSNIELQSNVSSLRQSITAINVTVDKSPDNNSV